MNKIHEWINTLLILGVLVLVLVGSNQSDLGAIGTRFPNGLAVGTTASVTQNKLTIGNSGTAIGNAIFGNSTCTRTGAAFAATTTEEWICASTGVTAGDKVFASLDYTNVQADGFGLYVTGVRATTSNVIGVRVANGSTVSTSTINAIYRNVNWFVVR